VATSIKQNERIWDLTIIVGLIVALSAAADVAGFMRFAPSLGLPTEAAALCVLPIKLIEWKFLTIAVRLWRQGWLGKFRCPVFVVIWGIAISLSALAAHATIYTMLATADHTAARNVETRRNLTVAMDRVNGQLDAFGKALPRPVKAVQGDFGWATSRRPALDCTRPLDEGSRDCRKIAELTRELAAASEYERLAQEAEKLREKLAGLQIEAAEDAMPQAYEATIGQFTKKDGKNGIAMLGMLILTMVSAFGPFGLDTLRRGRVTHARLQPPNLPAHSEGPETAHPELARPEPAHPGSARPRPAHPEPAVAVEPTHEPAQGGCPGPAHVIRFPAAPQGDCPPTADARLPAQPVAGRGLGQARRPAQRPPGSAAKPALTLPKGRADAAAAEVTAFVGMLDTGKQARATGSELAKAYHEQRLVYGWPELPANVLGMHLKRAVEELGGRKLKSNGQVYQGVCLPAAWRAPLAMSA
jgi:hypothetical protein